MCEALSRARQSSEACRRVALGEKGSETIERAVPSTLADRTEYSGGGVCRGGRAGGKARRQRGRQAPTVHGTEYPTHPTRPATAWPGAGPHTCRPHRTPTHTHRPYPSSRVATCTSTTRQRKQIQDSSTTNEIAHAKMRWVPTMHVPLPVRPHLAGSLRMPPPLAVAFELQSISAGRGVDHLSYDLADDDVVAFQVGTWLVDSVEVGDGSTPRLCFARVDNVQINWTHNCEHGVIRGTALELVDGDPPRLRLREDVDVEFGPEQLLARIPCDKDSGEIECPLPDCLASMALESYQPSPPPPLPLPPPSPPPMCPTAETHGRALRRSTFAGAKGARKGGGG